MAQVSTIVIDRRFNGPPASGNGGYVAGLLATHVAHDGAVEVTLRAPIPVDTPMTLAPDGAGYVLRHGEALICEVRPSDLALQAPAPPDGAEIDRLADAGGSDADSEFHDCLVCGRGRAIGDGLRVFGQRQGARSLARYMPHRAHAAADGRIAPAFLWGTLDCPGAVAVLEDNDPRTALTGRMKGQVFHRPLPGEPCVVVGWKLRSEGRKLFAGTALYTRSGTLCAFAETTWIVLG
jgi:hypothetical protein